MSKINWLVHNTAPGSIVLQQWLSEHDINRSLTQKYVKTGWLIRLAPGVYYRPQLSSENKPDWVDAVKAVSEQLKVSIHVAGLTSLAHQGLGHYLPMKSETVWIGSKNQHALPKWFRNFAEQRWVHCQNSRLKELIANDFKAIAVNGRQVKVSVPELAAYEVVEAIGRDISFEHAAELFQGLINLGPRRVQLLLNRSQSVRTNRIYLFLSHYYAHPWLKYIDQTQVELGTGKRQIVEGGKYDSRFQITVPDQYLSKEA